MHGGFYLWKAVEKRSAYTKVTTQLYRELLNERLMKYGTGSITVYSAFNQLS